MSIAVLDTTVIIHLFRKNQTAVAWLSSQGVGVMDCFIASVCLRLNQPIYTHNQKDFLKMLPPNLVVKPY